MAIDIKHVNTAANTHVAKSPTNKADAQQGQAKAAPVSTPTKSDSVSLTSQAQQLQSTQAKLGDIPEVDQNKVDEIKLAISEGRYKIDAEKLASNIAKFEGELKDL